MDSWDNLILEDANPYQFCTELHQDQAGIVPSFRLSHTGLACHKIVPSDRHDAMTLAPLAASWEAFVEFRQTHGCILSTACWYYGLSLRAGNLLSGLRCEKGIFLGLIGDATTAFLRQESALPIVEPVL